MTNINISLYVYQKLTLTLGVFPLGLAAPLAFFTLITFCGFGCCAGLEAIPVLTTSDHIFGLLACDGDTFLAGVLAFGENLGVDFLAALLVGVSPALLRIAAVSFGVASLPWMALIATAFLKSSGGDTISLLGVVVNFAFFALGGLPGDLLRLPFPGDFDFLLTGEAGLSGVAYLAGDTALAFGDLGLDLERLLRGDLLFRGLLPGDFLGVVFFGLLPGDLLLFGLFAFSGVSFSTAEASATLGLCVAVFFGLLPGDLLRLGLLPGDFLGVAFLGLLVGVFIFGGLFSGDFSSSIAVGLGVASDCRLISPLSGEPAAGADFLLGVAPLLSGVDAGNFLSKSSGLNLGPNETRFLFEAGSTSSPTDFLFCPGFGDLPRITKPPP